MYLKIAFGIVGFILTVLLVLRELGITKKLSPMRASDYVSTIACFLISYVILSFIIAFLATSVVNKVIFAFWGLLPFIIGRLVTYKKVKIYSIIQILCVILSIGYLFLI